MARRMDGGRLPRPRDEELDELAEEWCPDCGLTECDCDDDALYDADELGLDPENDDEYYIR